MNFEQALTMLKAGKRMQRSGWNGKNMFVYMVPGSMFAVSRPPLLGIFPEGTNITYRPHLDMRDAQGACGVWTPSQIDLFAEDWEEA